MCASDLRYSWYENPVPLWGQARSAIRASREGEIDWPEVFKALAEIGYRGSICRQAIRIICEK
jgi:sugar phosphate isomerase/epimerase